MKSLAQGAALLAIAVVLAVVSNAAASRDRKLVLPGYYPGATTVPAREIATQSAPALPASTAPAPAPTPAIAETTTQPTVTAAPETAQPARSPRPVPPAGAEPLKTQPPPVPARVFSPHPDKPYIEVSGDDALALHAQGALTIDARRTAAYEQGHIAGARSFSVWESDIDDKVNKLYEERSDPREQLKPILVYCSGGDCEDSHMLAQKLWGVQFNNIYVYKDGFPDWQQRRGAINTGSRP